MLSWHKAPVCSFVIISPALIGSSTTMRPHSLSEPHIWGEICESASFSILKQWKHFQILGFLWIPGKCTFLKPSCNLLPFPLICLSFTRLNGKNTVQQMAVTTAAVLTWPSVATAGGDRNDRKDFLRLYNKGQAHTLLPTADGSWRLYKQTIGEAERITPLHRDPRRRTQRRVAAPLNTVQQTNLETKGLRNSVLLFSFQLFLSGTTTAKTSASIQAKCLHSLLLWVRYFE